MNKEGLRDTTLALSGFHNTSAEFDLIRDKYVEKKDGESFELANLLEIQEAYKKRKDQMGIYKEQLAALEPLLGPVLFKRLSEGLNDSINSLGMVAEDVSLYIDSRDEAYLESLMFDIAAEKGTNDKLMLAMQLCEKNISLYMLSETMKDGLSINDLRTMQETLDAESPIYARVEEVIDAIEQKQEKEKPAPTEAVAKPTETVVATSTPAAEAEAVATVQPKPLTLEQKLSQINYENGKNYHEAVQNVTAEHHLEKITAQIKALEAKEKLSFKERSQLHTLKGQELYLQAYQESEDRTMSRSSKGREKQLGATDEKIEDARERLTESQELHKQYESGIMRFFSARYQERLATDIKALQAKSGLIQAKQRVSAVASFDAEMEKITKKAKRAGRRKAMGESVSNRINQLVQMKSQIVDEYHHLQHDVAVRFASRHEDVAVLQQMQGVMPDNVISLEEYRQSLVAQRAA